MDQPEILAAGLVPALAEREMIDGIDSLINLVKTSVRFVLGIPLVNRKLPVGVDRHLGEQYVSIYRRIMYEVLVNITWGKPIAVHSDHD